MSRASPAEGGGSAPVIELASARRLQRRDRLVADLARALVGNRHAITRLIHSNLLWTRRGARAGRQLLANWERLVDEAERLRHLDLSMPIDGDLIDSLFEELEALLAKSAKLESRSAELIAQSR